MSHQPIDKNFVSELDQFLESFDKKHPTLSESQQKERNKYLRIYRLRDTSSPAETETPATKLWEGF